MAVRTFRLAALAAPVLALLLLVTSIQPAQANTVDPQQLVSDVIGRVMNKLGTLDPGVPADDPLLLDVFRQELAPHLDFTTITQWLVGPPWANYTDAERETMIATVREHIVNVYAALLARGRDVVIEVAPSSTVLERSAKVSAALATADGRSIDIEFRLLAAGESWKLYDLVAAGVSFARSLRAELAPVITAGGVDGLRNYLARHQH
jgi:phospholipid transport system substrate-binding protein